MEVHRKWRRYVTVTGSNAWRYNYIIFNEFSSCYESLSQNLSSTYFVFFNGLCGHPFEVVAKRLTYTNPQ